MGSFSIWHWLIVIILVLLLFGKGRISDMMGDLGKGLKSFKQGMADEDKPATPPPARQIPTDRPIDITPHSREEGAVPPPPPADDARR